jgi:hypothetical protein
MEMKIPIHEMDALGMAVDLIEKAFQDSKQV